MLLGGCLESAIRQDLVVEVDILEVIKPGIGDLGMVDIVPADFLFGRHDQLGLNWTQLHTYRTVDTLYAEGYGVASWEILGRARPMVISSPSEVFSARIVPPSPHGSLMSM